MPGTVKSPTAPMTTPAIHALSDPFPSEGSAEGVGVFVGIKVCKTTVEVPDEARLAGSEADVEEKEEPNDKS